LNFLGADRIAQSPILVNFSPASLAVFAKKHARIFLLAWKQNKGVFSTTRLNDRIDQKLPL
jgi:hypothetical protein